MEDLYKHIESLGKEHGYKNDDIKFALWGTREIDDDVLDRVRQFAKFAQENEKNK